MSDSEGSEGSISLDESKINRDICLNCGKFVFHGERGVSYYESYTIHHVCISDYIEDTTSL